MADTLLTLTGQVERDIAALFLEQLAAMEREDAPVVLDLEEAEVDDASIATMLVDHIRQTAARVGTVRIIRPPQVIAHVLYRIGALQGSTIQLVEPREELGTSS
ncbi:STAS domain-containing protein [Myxococcota bacterium]|nr:STAS domain-containing protein [Myxococcota bacterium]